MRVKVTNPTTDEIIAIDDFDEVWKLIGKMLKFQLQTYDPDVTWINLHVSHDGKQACPTTIERIDQSG